MIVGRVGTTHINTTCTEQDGSWRCCSTRADCQPFGALPGVSSFATLSKVETHEDNAGMGTLPGIYYSVSHEVTSSLSTKGTKILDKARED